jgi:hypothetical protein
MKIYCFNTLFGAHQVEDVNLFIFKFSKFTIFIFRLFQSSELIKYVLNDLSLKFKYIIPIKFYFYLSKLIKKI